MFDHRRAFNARACAEQIPLEDRSLNEATAFVEVELTLFLQSIAEAVRTRQFLESECCACLSTPNGLRTLSVKSNLTSNPLTGVVPNNVVIKLIATTPVGSPCDPLSPAVTSVTRSNLASGMRAWGTSLTPVLPAGSYGAVETEFSLSPLRVSELQEIITGCTAIFKEGSGQGICSCGTGD